ncbi:hypothetical protein [Rhodococcus artemisiae]|uniref:Type VII secretion-associated protein (TIGR03931 family) n=1 Tax=Rhodococcus artemisiae TaxID=714159 RepID=A0ABU7LIZ9_9NOCA|nr:hypothetical protein [Rhodococcus artemisiae]MEE2061222.1 hypothetical protein [Rhodococcus artemisiae]
MRPVLGVAVDDGEVSAVLVDADVPQLGPFDSQRWAAGPDTSQADAVARAVTSMTERAENASLTVGTIGLVSLPSGEADTDVVAEAVRAVSEVPVEVVPLDSARLAYLAGAPELADTPVLAIHTRTGGVESVSIVDTRSRTVLSSVVRGGDDLTGHPDALPDTMDEALARAGVSPAALVFLDLRPGDAVPARELSTILGVPFVTPHGVPWHRPTGAALVASRRSRVQPAVAVGTASTRRILALMVIVIALLAVLGGGLALAMGGSGGSNDQSSSEQPGGSEGQSAIPGTTDFAPEADTPELWDRIAPHSVPRDAGAPDDAGAPPDPAPHGSDPCSAAQPASWPARGSDPAPSPVPLPAPDHAPEPAPPCDPPVDPAP